MSRDELARCKEALVMQLKAMETILKSIKKLDVCLDVRKAEQGIVDIYERIEECNPNV